VTALHSCKPAARWPVAVQAHQDLEGLMQLLKLGLDVALQTQLPGPCRPRLRCSNNECTAIPPPPTRASCRRRVLEKIKERPGGTNVVKLTLSWIEIAEGTYLAWRKRPFPSRGALPSKGDPPAHRREGLAWVLHA
jgi:hypothetical protein